jgi:hypothetical protein
VVLCSSSRAASQLKERFSVDDLSRALKRLAEQPDLQAAVVFLVVILRYVLADYLAARRQRKETSRKKKPAS